MMIDFQKPLVDKFKIKELNAFSFPHGPVTVTTIEGSFFCWYDAFYIDHGGDIYVYTEHYGYHRFEHDMLKSLNGPDKPKLTRKKK